MRIPGSTIGNFKTVADATSYKKIRDWKGTLDTLGGELKQLDQDPDKDLDDGLPGQVTISKHRTSVGYESTGRANFDPAGELMSMDVKGTEMGIMIPQKTTRYQFQDSPQQQRYTTRSWGVTHDLTIDKASGDWNYRTSFLGIPLS
jgi:hypothetical protein